MANTQSIINQFSITEQKVNDAPLIELREIFKMLFGYGAIKRLSLEFGKNATYASEVFSGNRNNPHIEAVIRERIYDKLFNIKPV